MNSEHFERHRRSGEQPGSSTRPANVTLGLEKTSSLFRVSYRLLRCGILSGVPHHIARSGLPRKMTPWGTSYKADNSSQFHLDNIHIEVDPQ